MDAVPAFCLDSANPMHPRLALLFAFATVFLAFHSLEAQQRIAFQRDDSVYTASADGSKPRKVATGNDPEISPDGTKLVFTVSGKDGSPERAIAIADLGTGKINRLKNLPSDNCYGATWSPDGASLIVNAYIKNTWQLVLIDQSGRKSSLPKQTSADNSLYAPAWARDGKSFFCHDLDAIYQFTLTGDLREKWPIATTFPHGAMSSASRIAASSDGAKLLAEIDMDAEVNRPGWDGPPPTLWILDLASGKAVQITKVSDFFSDATWLTNATLVAAGSPKTAGVEAVNIYALSTGGGAPRLLIKNASHPSVAAGK